MRFAILLLLATSCRVEQHEEDDTAGAATPAATDDVTRAVGIARALRSNPARSEADVLAEHGLSQEELGDMLYRIAADSAAATRYADMLADPAAGTTRPRPR